MSVEVRIGVAKPDEVDLDAVAEEVPYGTVAVTAESGGLDVESPRDNGDGLVIANAAILVSFDN